MIDANLVEAYIASRTLSAHRDKKQRPFNGHFLDSRSASQYASTINLFLSWLDDQGTSVSEVTAQDFGEFVRDRGYRQTSAHRAASILFGEKVGFFPFLAQQGIHSEQISIKQAFRATVGLAGNLSAPTTVSPITEKEYEQILSLFPTDTYRGSRDALISMLLFRTGAFLDNIMVLKEPDLTFVKGVANVTYPRAVRIGSSKHVSFEMTPQEEGILTPYPELLAQYRSKYERGGDFLFISRVDDSFSARGFRRTLETSLKDTPFADLSAYQLRQGYIPRAPTENKS